MTHCPRSHASTRKVVLLSKASLGDLRYPDRCFQETELQPYLPLRFWYAAYHCAASFCASAIWAGVMRLATEFHGFVADWLPSVVAAAEHSRGSSLEIPPENLKAL